MIVTTLLKYVEQLSFLLQFYMIKTLFTYDFCYEILIYFQQKKHQNFINNIYFQISI